MKILLGASTHNAHVQNIALALAEQDRLGRFVTAGADHFDGPVSGRIRALLPSLCAPLDRSLKKRRIDAALTPHLCNRLGWEVPRSLSVLAHMDPLFVDWLWDRGEHSMSRYCAKRLHEDRFDAFMGVEYGALEAIREARQVGKWSIVAFLSPHHLFRRKWLEPEYRKFPELLTPQIKRLEELSVGRDARRDAEALEADIVHTNSELTKRTLVDAGVDAGRIISVPLGSPGSVARPLEPRGAPGRLTVIFAGAVSIHKGAHHLLEAWKRLKCRGSAELHLYGPVSLPARAISACGPDVHFHGAVSKERLAVAMREALIMAFPTLYDGFGMVVMEAMAQGLPVITTPNAGSSTFIRDGVNGYLVPPADIRALADALDGCLSSPSRVRSMREAAGKTAESWTWKSFRESFNAQLTLRLSRRSYRASGGSG